jgi:hypothetical protein
MFWPTPGYLKLRTSSVTPSIRSQENCRSQSILSWLLTSPAFYPVRQISSQHPAFYQNTNQLKAIKIAKHFFEKQKSPGAVVLTSSTGGICGEAYLPVYTTTKHGVCISLMSLRTNPFSFALTLSPADGSDEGNIWTWRHTLCCLKHSGELRLPVHDG